MMLKKGIKAITLISLTCALLCSLASAQTIKYDDIISDIDHLSPQTRYNRFLQYQKQNPQFSNTYIQLGDACEKIINNLDPLRNIDLVKYWANNAILYYGLFPAYLKPNDVRRNLNYYTNIPIPNKEIKLENEDALMYTQSRIKYFRNLNDSITIIYNTLEKSKDHYNKCVRIFNEINAAYDNINEALLQTNPDLLAKLSILDNEYTETINEFSNYQELIKKFPIGQYKQSYAIVPINTFRLDGLTNSNFTQNSFNIWNYKLWVDDFKKTFNTEIVPLRTEINSLQKTFNENKRMLSITEKVNDDQTFSTYNDLFMFRLGKFDNNSLVRELFRYLDVRQDFLVLSKSPLNSPKDSTLAITNRKLRYYHRLALQKETTKEYLDIMQSSISTERVNRFVDFFNQQYKGEQGLKQFCTQEYGYLNQTLEESFNNLKAFLIREKELQQSLGLAIGSRGVNMPLFKISENNFDVSKLTHISQQVQSNQGVPQYISGYLIRSDKKQMAFVAKIKEGNRIEWIKEAGARGAAALPLGNNVWAQFGYDGGCMTIVTDQNEAVYSNTLVGFDYSGKEFLQKSININSKPVHLNYDDINQKSLMVFGHTDIPDQSYFSSFIVSQTDSLGNANWITPLDIQGHLVDVIKSGTSYLAFFNYNYFELNGNRKTADNWGLLMVTISEQGKIIKFSSVDSQSDYHIDRVFPISNDEISLIGYGSDPLNKSGQLKYLILAPDGKVIFKNL